MTLFYSYKYFSPNSHINVFSYTRTSKVIKALWLPWQQHCLPVKYIVKWYMTKWYNLYSHILTTKTLFYVSVQNLKIWKKVFASPKDGGILTKWPVSFSWDWHLTFFISFICTHMSTLQFRNKNMVLKADP